MFYYHITVFTVRLYYCCITVILLLIYWYFTPVAYCQFTIALLHLVLFTVYTFHNSIVKCWIQKCCDSVAILEDLLTQLYLMFPTWAMAFVYIRLETVLLLSTYFLRFKENWDWLIFDLFSCFCINWDVKYRDLVIVLYSVISFLKTCLFLQKEFKTKLLANTKVTQTLPCFAIYVIALDFCTFAVLHSISIPFITEKFLRVI